MEAQGPKKTGIYDLHLAHKGRMVDFAGWMLPISYGSVVAEHKAVRQAAGLFDVGHMGEIFISGPDARNFLQFMTTNDVDRLGIGSGQYSALLNENAGFIDDLIAYRLEESVYLLCVNASNIAKDLAWLNQAGSDFNVKIENRSEQFEQLALQGPASLEVLAHLLNEDDRSRIADLKYMQITEVRIAGNDVLCARTGYTGELGVELYIPKKPSLNPAPLIWEQLMEVGEPLGLKPVGLGARDSLRLEAGYLLYGQDMDETVNPLEVGIHWAVRMNCGEFFGKEALETPHQQINKRSLQKFILSERGIPRPGMIIIDQKGKQVGKVSSGGFLPTLDKAGGFALISQGDFGPLFVEIRGEPKSIEIRSAPFYKARVKD